MRVRRLLHIRAEEAVTRGGYRPGSGQSPTRGVPQTERFGLKLTERERGNRGGDPGRAPGRAVDRGGSADASEEWDLTVVETGRRVSNMTNPNTAAIESLRTFALAQCVSSAHPHDYANNDVFVRFGHLCTAALAGEEWAVERIASLCDWLSRISNAHRERVLEGNGCALRDAIRATDTLRPDSAVARSIHLQARDPH